MNDHEKARKLREGGWKGPSASDKAKAKGGRSGRSSSRSEPASGDVVEALRNFDPSRPKETAVPRSDESVERAHRSKFRLPRLG